MSQNIENHPDILSSGLRVARLVTGENVIGRMEDNLLVNIFKINFSFDTNFGGSNIALVPYMFPITPKLDYFIPINQCIVIDNAPDNLSRLYVETLQKIIQESVALQQQKQETQINQESEEEQNGSDSNEE